MADTRRLIVVTGTPRSGTTPVGDALALAPGTRTLYEPLNAHVGDRRVRRYFEVPGTGGFTDDLLDELVDDVRRLRLRLRPGLFPEDRGWRRLVKRVTGSRTLATYRRCRLDPRLRTLVWKDPFAVFLTRRLAAVHGIPVVATVRPPRAVAASFTRLGWGFDVVGLLDRLAASGRDHRHLLEGVDPAVPAHNAAVLWHVVNSHLLAVSREAADVHLVDLDAVVADREGTIRRLHHRLGLRWTAATAAALADDGRRDGPATPTGRAHDRHRDATAVNRYWVDVLDEADVAVVDRLTAELWDEVRSAAASPG